MDEEEKKVEETQATNEPEVVTSSAETVEKKGFNITSMILGIISLLSFCWWYISLPTGIIAIIFSIAGRKNAGRGMGIAGLVLGIIGLILCILIYLLIICGILAANSLAY